MSTPARNKKRHYQQQVNSNSGMQATVNTRNSTSKTVVLATANSIDRSKERDANNKTPKQQGHQEQLELGMPATTGTHKGQIPSKRVISSLTYYRYSITKQ
jgi:hypothetical protein